MEKIIYSFLEYLRYERNMSEHTLAAYSRDLAEFAAFYKREVSPQNSSKLDLFFTESSYEELEKLWPQLDIFRGYIYHLAQKNYAKRTIARNIATLKSWHKFLAKKGYIQKNGTDLLQFPKLNRPLPSILTEKEVNGYLEAGGPIGSRENIKDENIKDENIKDENIKEEGSDYNALLAVVIIELIYSSGMRVSELSSVKLQDIYGEQIKVTGKGNKERFVFLGRAARIALDRYLHERQELLSQKPKNKAGDMLLVSRHGNPLSSRSVRYYLSQWQKKLRGKKLYPHLLRHSFATHLLNQGCSIRAVQEFLGHSSLAATQVYLHLSRAKLKDIYQKHHPHGS